MDFVASGGYALNSYERYRRLGLDAHGFYRVSNISHVKRYRMNVGTIVEAPVLKVRMRNGRVLGEVEEYFVNALLPGDSFIFAGQLLAFEGLRENTVLVSRAKGGDPKVPAYAGGRLAALHPSGRAGARHPVGPGAMAEPAPGGGGVAEDPALALGPARCTSGLLVETFPRGEKEFLVAYCFEGRNAHQTLGMLLTKRMERAGLAPLGFVATDYVIAVWSLKPAEDLAALFDEDMLGDDLEEWMAESSMLKRTFRKVAVIAGLIEARAPGQEKSGRQVTFNADLIYDVLRKHEPDHILLQATRADAAGGLTDIGRLAEMLKRVKGRIEHRRLEKVSPLAVPVLLEVGKEQVYGSGLDELLDEGAQALIDEATEGLEIGIGQAELPL